MHILLISDHADPLAEIGSKEAGGQNIYIFYLAKFLSQLGVYVDVFTRWDRQNKKQVVCLNSHVRVIRVKAGPKRYIPRDTFIQYVDEFADNILKFVEQNKIKYDILHANYWFSGVVGIKISQKIRVPMTFTFHSIGQVRFDSLKKFKIEKRDYILFQNRILWEKMIVKKADRIISTSPVEKQLIKRLFNAPADKIQVISIGVDLKIFNPVDKIKARKKINKNIRRKIILYVGRFEWRKGIGTLIFAIKELVKHKKKVLLLIVGGGRSKTTRKLEDPECIRLKKIIEDLELQDYVKFCGPKKQEELRYYYSAADVVVVPSYYEPFGIIPLEAMACGTSVVASKTGGLKYTVLDEKTGYLSQPRDSKDLAKNIARVFKQDKELYFQNCLERINKKFQWHKIAEEYYSFFLSLIKK